MNNSAPMQNPDFKSDPLIPPTGRLTSMKYDSSYCYKLEKSCEKWLAETIGGGDAIHAEDLAKFVHSQVGNTNQAEIYLRSIMRVGTIESSRLIAEEYFRLYGSQTIESEDN